MENIPCYIASVSYTHLDVYKRQICSFLSSMIPSLLRGLRKNKFSFKGRVILLELKEIDFENYGKCVQLSNGVIDVVVTIDCGPRIVRFGFVGGENVLYND